MIGLKNWRKFKVRELLGLSGQNCLGSPQKFCFLEIWYLTYLLAGFGIHMKYRARFSIGSLIKGCQIGFSGPGISLIWSSVFGIWFGRVSGLKLCLGGGTPKITLGITETKLWVEIKGLKNAIGDPRFWIMRGNAWFTDSVMRNSWNVVSR